MAIFNIQLWNHVLIAILLSVPAITSQMPSCGFQAIGKHLKFDDRAMKTFTADIISELEISLDIVSDSAIEYVQKLSFSTNLISFYDEWHESHEIPWMQGYQRSTFQDRPDITCSQYTDRVRQLFVPFNRILHYLNITERSDKTSGNTVVGSTLTKSINQIRSDVKQALKSVLCSMYKYLALANSDLHIESLDELDQLVEGSISDKRDVVSGLLYVYLTQAFEQLLDSSELFVNS